MAKKSYLTGEDAALQSRLGATIRLHRKQLGITQEELAWRADLHRTYIADIERGGRNVTLRSIANLAKALEVSVDGLLTGANEVREAPRAPIRPGAGEVLLVEDNEDDAQLTLRAFKLAQFANPVRWVREGEAALDYLLGTGPAARRRTGPLPQLVLLDLMLPGVPGLEVLRRMRDDARTRTLPVVVLTGSTEDDDIAECRRLGAAHYLVKPVGFDTFCEVTSRLRQRWLLLEAEPSLPV